MEQTVFNYRIIIEPEEYEDGSIVYVAFCPTLGISDYGETIEQALDSIKDGIELAVEHLAKEKKEIPVDHIEQQIITATRINPPKYRNISFAS